MKTRHTLLCCAAMFAALVSSATPAMAQPNNPGNGRGIGGGVITPLAPCGMDVTSKFASSATFFMVDRSGQYTHYLTLSNNTGAAVNGPIFVVVDQLSTGARLDTRTGLTPCGFDSFVSPYLKADLGGINKVNAGGSMTMKLTFTKNDNASIAYQVKVFAGYEMQPRPVWGDYDGDGKADPAIMQQGTQNLKVLYSKTGSATFWSFGMPGEHSVIADFDGDGKTDVAMFNPSTLTWRWVRSSDSKNDSYSHNIVPNGKKIQPVPADYDGDGKDDPAYFTPEGGIYRIYYSATKQQVGHGKASMNDPQMIAIPGDYDGDGKADRATFDPVWGQYQIVLSSNAAFITLEELIPLNGKDKPVFADFDGDGRTDLGVCQEPAAGNDKCAIRSSFSGQVTEFYMGMYESPNPFGADFDGDGRSDMAYLGGGQQVAYVYYPAIGTELVKTTVGLPGDEPTYDRLRKF